MRDFFLSKKTFLLIILLAGWGLYTRINEAGVAYDHSVTVRSEPQQINLSSQRPFDYKGFTIIPLAKFNIEARVLSKEHYFWGTESRLSSYDLALGWGPMSNYNVLKNLEISQSNRWYYYSYKEPPILPNEIISHSANMHLIAANDQIKREIAKARKGQIISLKGYLIEVTGQNGWHWRSSLTRNDSGDGSCELIWVEAFTIKS